MNEVNELSARARALQAKGWNVPDIATVLHVPDEIVSAWLAREELLSTAILTFEEWVPYLFDNPPDYRWFDHILTGNELPSVMVVDYLTRLFSEAGTILAGFTDAQINQTLWFLIGEGSDGAFALFDETVPWAMRRDCLQATLHLFTDCFLPRCTSSLSHRSEPAGPLNSICYMWWDIFPTWGSPGDANRVELDALVLDLQQRILYLQSDACHESALHGLGHWMPRYPRRVETIVDEWLQSQAELRPELRAYALAARSGCVQ